MHPFSRTAPIHHGGLRRAVLVLAAIALAGAAASSTESAALWVRPIEESPPPVLERVPDDPGLNAVTVTVDGSRAAASFVQQLNEKKFRSTIRFYHEDSDEPIEISLSGEVRDLMFSPEGSSLYALIHVPAKKRPGDTKLLRIDTTTGKTERRLVMPPSALGLAYRAYGDALLIVCAQEIRSVLLPDLRSGPLYRLLGLNTSATLLDESRLLVGREDGLSVIDLDDPPGEEQMPVRARIDSNDMVVQVATNRDASTILVRYLEGGIASVDLASAALVPDLGDGVLPRRPWHARSSVQGLPEKTEPPAEPVVAAGAGAAAAAVAVEDEDEAAAPPATEPVAATAVAGEADERPVETSPDDPDSGPEVGPAAQVAGTLSGPGVDDVSHVVLFGPDNITREATRVVPDAAGNWSASGLARGRYRIQLVATGGRVPIADPPFHVVDVQDDRPTVEASFQVLEPR